MKIIYKIHPSPPLQKEGVINFLSKEGDGFHNFKQQKISESGAREKFSALIKEIITNNFLLLIVVFGGVYFGVRFFMLE